ncbi:MAG: hypothetical protein C0617_03575 [Desulfuromonas sp.]|uniref:TnsD family transposase n=1 Tax=Desulfuromonas sp. TaxID=892 RepID=UPI000CAEBF77|nr:TnsD family transposase [Desulfuromonas sp.]PLX85588.1 MAG: hypothetical protein C0617_03575 [Desulfuromonas sp.]
MAIDTFPEFQRDELFYSVISRHKVRLGYQDPKDITEDLFGSRTAAATYDFPCRLRRFCKRLPKDAGITPSSIIKDNTLFPIYEPFLAKARAKDIRKKMACSDFGGAIHNALGVMASGVRGVNALRCCPECVDEDRVECGEAYWHRSHQFPGVAVCHKHKVPLLESHIRVTSRQNKMNFQALEKGYDREWRELASGNSLSLTDVWIAEKVHWILGQELPIWGLGVLRKKYVAHLIRLGLASPLGRVRQREFEKEFVAAFGKSYLKEVWSDVEGECNWLIALVRKPRKATHPLRHLLLMKFLGTEPEEFFPDCGFGNQPFGMPPFPCLNPACRSYRKPAIEEVKITRHTNSGAVVGNFECECGFAYARTGPDTTAEDRFKRTRIISMGSVWEKELQRLDKDPSVGLRMKARFLGVDPNTIVKYLARLNGSGEIRSQKNDDEKGERIAEYRSRLVSAIEENPEKSRTEIRGIAKADYIWLYRHDREWLMDNLPPSMPRSKSSDNRVDWVKRDDDLFSRAKEAIPSLLISTPPQRVTKGRVGQMINSLALLEKHLEKLPKTKQLIERNEETLEDYQLRRVRLAARELRTRGENFAPWAIVRKAGLRPGYSKKVLREIERLAFAEV